MNLIYWIGVYAICVEIHKVERAIEKGLYKYFKEREESRTEEKRERELGENVHPFKAKAMKMKIGF